MNYSYPLPRAARPLPSTFHRIESLEQLVLLERQRLELQQQLDALMTKVTSLNQMLFAPNATHVLKSIQPSGDKAHQSNDNIPRRKRGQLRNLIFNALQTAGTKGIHVRTLSRSLGINSVNIHSWFHGALKRHPEITKLAPGQYRLEQDPTPISQPVQSKAGKRMRAKRGEISRKITGLLNYAGANGMSIGDIATRLGTNYRNIHVWFSSTGKKNPNIHRVARGIYRLDS